MNTAPKQHLEVLRQMQQDFANANGLTEEVVALDYAIEAMTALAPSSGEGVDGWKLVPLEPDERMFRAAHMAVCDYQDGHSSIPDAAGYMRGIRHAIYSAMVDAAPATTPQSAPVDVIGPDEVVVHREILENADAALAISNHKGSAWSEHESPRYEIRELLGLPYEKRTTPPPASQGEGWQRSRRHPSRRTQGCD